MSKLYVDPLTGEVKWLPSGGVDGRDGAPGDQGPAGPPGEHGADGRDGPRIVFGKGKPENTSGFALGDLYIDQDSGDLYQHSAWKVAGLATHSLEEIQHAILMCSNAWHRENPGVLTPQGIWTAFDRWADPFWVAELRAAARQVGRF